MNMVAKYNIDYWHLKPGYSIPAVYNFASDFTILVYAIFFTVWIYIFTDSYTYDWIRNQEEVTLCTSEPGYQGWLQLYSNIACFHPGYKKIGF